MRDVVDGLPVQSSYACCFY